MGTNERILLAVDDSDAARRSVRYVGQMVAGRGDVTVLLYHRLPALPPVLREHGGAEDPRRETELGRELTERIADWVDGLESGFLSTLDSLRKELTECGVAPDAVSFVVDRDVFPGESLADALRRVARERDCHTIVVADEHVPGIRGALYHHTGDALVKEGSGFALWVVE